MRNKSIFFYLIILFCSQIFARPNKPENISDETDERIVTVLQKAQADVFDLNGDGKINCIDYTVMFKLTWDKEYPDRCGACQIIRNYSPTMNHLFVHIWAEGNQDIEIEPWAYNPYRYLMTDNWRKGTYNPKYNNYGETETWLREAKKGRVYGR